MAERRITESRTFHLSIYHRLPRLRLAIAATSVFDLIRYARERGWTITRVSLWCRYPIRWKPIRDGRVIISTEIVEAHRLRPCSTYTFHITFTIPPVPPPVKKLHKIKIRLYNEEIDVPTPTGTFQGFFDILAPVDSDTLEPDWNHWYVKRQIEACKWEMYIQFNTPYRWDPIEKTLLAYMEEREGIAYSTKTVTEPISPKDYRSRTPPLIPEEYIGTVTIEELIVGLSSIAPVEVKEIEPAKKQRIMVIKAGVIKYDSGYLGYVVSTPSEREIVALKREFMLA